MKKTIIFIMILIILFTLPHVSAIDENSTDLISATNDDELISSDNEYIDYDDPDTEFILEINDTKDYETTGNITFYIYFNGTLSFGPEIYDFIKEPITIYENNKNVGTVPVNQINYTTFNQGGNNVFNATFTCQIQNKTQIRLHYTAWDTNTLTIEKILEPEIKALTTQAIIIRDKNGIKYTSNNTWNNSIKYLEKAINVASANDEIILTNINIQTTPIFTNPTQSSTINVNKNLKIIGNNAAINANKNSHLFEINSNVTFINMTFTNFSSYLFKNHGNLTFINCTFKDSYTRFINNTGNLIILNSTFKNMKEYYSNAQISLLKDYYTEIGLIYNTGNLQIDNSVFDNFDYPKEIEIDNFTIKELGVIYNLNSATITNTNFTNINTRAINNTGNLKLEKTLFENITTNTLKILINTSEFNKISENTIYQSYTGYREKTTYTTYESKNYFLNGGAVYNTNNLTISESQFRNIISYYGGAIFNEGNATVNSTNFINTESSGGMGGAIFNNAKMTLENTTINNSKANLNNIQIGKNTFIQITHGGAIYNNQTLTLDNSIITQSTAAYGGAIANNGQIIINNTILDKNYANNEGYTGMNYGETIFNDENGNCIIHNSNIKNTIAKRTSIGGGGSYGTYGGIIYNLGDLTISKTIFDNMSGKYEDFSSVVGGSFTIFNYGKMNVTNNYFINSPHKEHRWSSIGYLSAYTYAYTNDQNNAYMSNNYYCLNTDPYTIDTNFPVNDYFILTFDPDYYALNLNEVRNITLKLKLASGKEFSNYELLPKANVTIYTYDENGNKINFTKELTNGQVTFPYNYTSTKGRYIISAEMGGGKCIAEIDVGKNKSYMDIKAEDIYYEDNAIFIMNVTGNLTNQPTGNVSIILDGKKYTAEINNTKANLTIPNMQAKTYDLIIRYEGDEDYFKYIHHQNFTVYKKPTGMTLQIPDVYYGERAIGRIFLNTSKYSVKDGHIYITDENNQTTVNQIAIRNNTYVRLTNFASGDLKITVELIGNENYESSNATVIFKIKKYETNLTINASDINAGESETITVTLTPEGEVAGEANLTINNKTETIYLKNGNNTVTLENLTGGSYNITIFFPGDKKYANSSANTVLNVKKHNTTMDVTVEEDKITVKVNPPNATGIVNLYINDQLQKLNLTNGSATFTPNYNKFNNSIFIYYEGDNYYNYTTFNTAYENNKLANLTGYDVLTYDGEAGTIYVTLTDERGYGIAGKNITITINNKKYTQVTNQSGIASLTLTLPIGNYTITSTYESYIVNNTFSVLKNINMTTVGDIEVYDNERFTYYVKLTDGRNNNIKNEEVTFTVNGQTYTNKTNNNGIARIFLTLNKGNYTITAKYKTETLTNKINVRENDNYTLTANDLEMYYRDGSVFNVTLKDGNGNTLSGRIITYTINNNTYQRTTDKNGVASLQINLAPGKYEIKTTYIDTSTTNKILIKDYPVIITGEDVEMYYRDGTKYTVSLKDTRGIALTNVNVIFTVNGENYTRTTNKEGIASITINLPEGTYTITASYKNASTTNKIVVKDYAPVITGNDVEMYYHDGTNYTITLKNTKGSPLINVDVTFTIDGENYTRATNKDGIASITINLPEGVYSITATYRNVSTTNKIIVKDYEPVITGSDVEMYYRDGTNYTITLKNTQGTQISNVDVIFNINNRNYTRITDSNGIARITINLPAGTYNIKATYKNASTTNKVTVKDYEPVITGSDVEMYYRDGTNYTITLKNSKGTVLSNRIVTFNINNRDYNRTTNSNGEASVTINLPAGTYTIKVTYANVSTTNKITVKEYAPVITGNDVEMYYRDGTNYTITLKNSKGDILSNKVVTFNVDGDDYNRTTNSNGEASVTINLPAGTYTIKTTYRNVSTTNRITVKEYPPVLTTEDLEMYFHDNSTFKATLTNANGDVLTNRKVTFTIGNETYMGTTNNQGVASIAINLAPGNYTIKTAYQNLTKTNNIEIRTNYNLETKDLVMIYKDGSRFTAKLTDKNGNTLKNATVLFTINGQLYTRKTNDEGIASIAINLNSGIHTITTRYQEEFKTNNITIKATVEANDVVKVYRNATQYYAKFTDNAGKVLKNTQVTFNINGVYYTRTTNESGVAKLNLNLPQGKYVLTAINPVTGENAANNITILSTITENRDITKYYKNATQYTVKLIKPDGSIAGAGEKVTFNINGVYYERTTNESGIAKMNINLNPGDYIITAEYAGCKVSNKIKVLPTIKAQDLTKKYGVSSPFTATLLDGTGKPLANEKVTFNINGVFYTRTTDADGIAKLNINLQAGKYIITSSYNGLNVANTVTVQN